MARTESSAWGSTLARQRGLKVLLLPLEEAPQDPRTLFFSLSIDTGNYALPLHHVPARRGKEYDHVVFLSFDRAVQLNQNLMWVFEEVS